jgi:hypothetical protein
MIAALLLAATVVVGQDEKAEAEAKPPEPKKAGDIEIGDPGVPIADRAVAASEVARFQSAMKEAKRKKDAKRRLELIKKLGEKDHPVIYKEATKWVKDKDFKVATAAVVAIARQKSSAKKAGPFLQKVLGREKRTDIVCAAIVGMGVLNYKKAYKDVRKQWNKTRTEPHKAAARYFGYTKAKQAFRMLAEELDEPRPANPNDPNNPPASYWEERWHQWKENEKAVQWALSQIVEGESFETTVEAKEWAKKHGKEHGIEW